MPLIQKRAAIIQAVRRFFDQEGFLEVDTPIRIPAPVPEAHIDPVTSEGWYLQASPEICMKRLVAQGNQRIYQICKCFRKNERSSYHLPELTMLEWYAANQSYLDLMNCCEKLIRFLADALGPETPWHVSRFHPTYRLKDRASTPVETLITAREIGLKAGLRYVYTGNVPGEEAENTFCHQCGKAVIQRWGFQIRKYDIDAGRCNACGAEIDGIGL